jgi:cyclic pyranopterin phosphate synthase
MPEEEYVWLPREDLLRYEEISDLVDIFLELGADKLRLTGGEPLLRRDLGVLVRMLATKPGLRDLALTTNGVLLAESARSLLDAGLGRVTVSLDSLRPERFKSLTRGDAHAKVLEGIEVAVKVGFKGVKLDAVIMRGINDDEIVDLVEYGKRVGAEVRFIEYMDVGGATRWSADKVFSRAAMLDVLARHYGPVSPAAEKSSAPAERFVLPDGTWFGIISSTTAPFCRSCDRSRLTADGMWYLCLYAAAGVDLRRPLRAGNSKDKIKRLIVPAWRERRDRGAEERLETTHRLPLVRIEELRRDSHLEMHTRGG